jgi:hypothetical protein
VIGLGILRHHGGRIAEANLARSPVCGSRRRSLTRGTLTSTAPALVSTSRGWWLHPTPRMERWIAAKERAGRIAMEVTRRTSACTSFGCLPFSADLSR